MSRLSAADYSAVLCAGLALGALAGTAGLAVFLAARLTAGRAAFWAAGCTAVLVAALAAGLTADFVAGLAVDLVAAPAPVVL
jgi:hypothetical protein